MNVIWDLVKQIVPLILQLINRNTSCLYVSFNVTHNFLSSSMTKSKWNNCVVIRKILLFTCDRASHSIKLVINAKIFTIYWFLTTLLLLLDFAYKVKDLKWLAVGVVDFYLFKEKKPVLKILFWNLAYFAGRYFDWKVVCIGIEKTRMYRETWRV